MKKQEKIVLRAIYEKDVEKFLGKVGLLEEIKSGDISCSFCGETMTIANFGGILRKKEKLRFFCDRIECYVKMLKERRKGS